MPGAQPLPLAGIVASRCPVHARAGRPRRAAARNAGVGLHEAGVGFCAALGWAGAGACGQRSRSCLACLSRSGSGRRPGRPHGGRGGGGAGGGAARAPQAQPQGPAAAQREATGRRRRPVGPCAQAAARPRAGGPVVARGHPRVMHSGGPPHPRQGVEKGGASAGRPTIGYRVSVSPGWPIASEESQYSPSESVSEPAERAVCA